MLGRQRIGIGAARQSQRREQLIARHGFEGRAHHIADQQLRQRVTAAGILIAAPRAEFARQRLAAGRGRTVQRRDHIRQGLARLEIGKAVNVEAGRVRENGPQIDRLTGKGIAFGRQLPGRDRVQHVGVQIEIAGIRQPQDQCRRDDLADRAGGKHGVRIDRRVTAGLQHAEAGFIDHRAIIDHRNGDARHGVVRHAVFQRPALRRSGLLDARPQMIGKAGGALIRVLIRALGLGCQNDRGGGRNGQTGAQHKGFRQAGERGFRH